MRMLRCDVCETDHDWSDEERFFVLEVPGQELEVGAQGTYSLDICSPDCLLDAAKALAGEPKSAPEEMERTNGQLKRLTIPSPRVEVELPPGTPHYEGGVSVR